MAEKPKKVNFDFPTPRVRVMVKSPMLKSIYTQPNQVLLSMLRSYRERCRIPQHELARRLGKEQSAVSKIERGERRLDIIELKAWLDALDMDFLVFVQELNQKLAALPSIDPRLASGRRQSTRRRREDA
jgi:transcriptional regulator with XRE-family HTH domain